MDPSVVLPALMMTMGTAAIVTAIVAQERRRRRTEQSLELTSSGDWGLDRLKLWPNHDQFWFTNPGGAPRMGRVRWTHEATRSGRTFLVAEEMFPQGKSSAMFVVVVARLPRRDAMFFTNGGDVEGALPPHLADALRSFVDRGGRAVIVYDGLLVLRCRRHEDAADALALAEWVVGQMALTVEPPVELPPSGTTWQQPPRRHP